MSVYPATIVSDHQECVNCGREDVTHVVDGEPYCYRHNPHRGVVGDTTTQENSQ